MPPDRALRGSEKGIRITRYMTEDLAFFLGAYLSEGHTNRSNWTVVITNSVLEVLERTDAACQSAFGLRGVIRRQADKCPGLAVSSKRLVEYLDLLNCGQRASNKQVPKVIFSTTRAHALAFMQGVALDAYTTHQWAGKWAICLESRHAIDQLQDLMTKLGIVNAQIPKLNKKNGKTYYELYAAGPWGQAMCRAVPFLEPNKAASASVYLERVYRTGSTDRIPGLAGPELYRMVPQGRSGHRGRGTGRQAFRHLCDRRTQRVTRASVERAIGAGAVVPVWLREVIDANIRFVEVFHSGVRAPAAGVGAETSACTTLD